MSLFDDDTQREIFSLFSADAFDRLTQIQDEVIIGWVVMKDGTLDGIHTTKGKSRQLNEFLVQIISELPGTWTTARLNGQEVRYYMSIPLNFMQREANFQEIELSPGGVMHYNKY